MALRRRPGAGGRRATGLAVLPVALLAAVLAASPVRALDTSAGEAILIDEASGTVLLEKNAIRPTFPSSMTKLMTVYLLFERLAAGALALDDTFPVSEKAWRMGGSKMFVEVGSDVRIEDLVRGIVVQSGNDATIVVAEGLAGSEQAFAQQMTAKARELGMTGTVFRNASGWPDPEHVTTVADLALLVRRTIEDFPDYYHYYAEQDFTFGGIAQANRNPLLHAGIGADGLKTGYTEAAGYGLAASAQQDGRRLTLVMNGLSSARVRADEAERLLQWGFRAFDAYRLLAAGETVGEAEVWLGEEESVPLVLNEDLTLTLSHEARRAMVARIVYPGPVPAPIAPGQAIARLAIDAPGMATVERELVAGAAVDELPLAGRLAAALGYLLFGPPADAQPSNP